MMIAHPPYAPVGRCIYCSAARHSPHREKLGDEHIIPEGLGGTFVLPRASCGECEGMTCSIEAYCQKPMFGVLRYQPDLPTKRPKDRPTVLPLRLFIDGRWQTREVSVAEYPLLLSAPVMPLPVLLDGPNRPDGGDPAAFFWGDLSSVAHGGRIVQKFGASGLSSDAEVSIEKFGRMLAKIAHV